MRLQAAIPVSELEGFGARPRRRRRRRRRKRRRKDEPRQLRRARAAQRTSRSEEPSLKPAPTRWTRPEEEVIDVEWTEVSPEEQSWPSGVQGLSRRARARRARREAWGPSVRMGRHLRIRAASGYRAAVIDLKPGLYLVAELPEDVSQTEFGIAPLLAPLMVRAAKRALSKGPQDKPGPLSALFRKARDGGAVKLFQAREARALPGPAPKATPKADNTLSPQ